jgi:hypothetical protein
MTGYFMNPDVVRPHWGWFALLDGGLVVLLAVSLSERAYGSVPEIGPLRLPPQKALRRLLGATAAIHVVEAGTAARQASLRDLPVRRWMLQTLVVGFPSLLALRRAGVQQAI